MILLKLKFQIVIGKRINKPIAFKEEGFIKGMEILRIILSSAIKVADKNTGTISSLLIAKDIKECLNGLYGVNINSCAVLVPFKFPNVVEVYNLDNKKIDLIIKRFFSKGRKIELVGNEYTITGSETVKFIWNERVLKGYGNKRSNKYKTINPIFLKNLFPYGNNNTGTIDIEDFKQRATLELKKYFSSLYLCSIEVLRIKWEKFNITFSKCSLDEKNQICFYGILETNFVPPIFIGDYTSNGFGKLVLLKGVTSEKEKFESIKIRLASSEYLKIKHCAELNNLSVLSFVKQCIKKEINS